MVQSRWYSHTQHDHYVHNCRHHASSTLHPSSAGCELSEQHTEQCRQWSSCRASVGQSQSKQPQQQQQQQSTAVWRALRLYCTQRRHRAVMTRCRRAGDCALRQNTRTGGHAVPGRHRVQNQWPLQSPDNCISWTQEVHVTGTIAVHL